MTMPFKTKIPLILLRIFLFFALLEIGLRLGGFFILSLQEYRNMQSVKHRGSYRIMCLGDSSTQGQYPRFLEEILNQRNTGIQFSVIDKGLGGTATSVIVAELESNLNTYDPGMVVAMIGANDAGPHICCEAASTSKIVLFLKSFRTYRLARLLWLPIVTTARQMHTSPVLTEGSLKQGIESNPQNYYAYVELGRLYREQRKFSQAEDAFAQAIKLEPQNARAYVQLGWCYRAEGKFSQAEDAFVQAIKLDPKNDEECVRLGWFYRKQGKFSQAEESLKQAIKVNPENDKAFIRLGWLYQDQGKFSQAEDAFAQAIKLNPQNERIYVRLGRFCQARGKLSQAEALFKKAIELNPQDSGAYIALGWFYQKQGRLSESEALFRKATGFSSQDARRYIELGQLHQARGELSQAEALFKKAVEANDYCAYGTLSVLYEENGNLELARAYAKEADKLRLAKTNPVTVKNYHKLKDILDKKGIRLVCVQYPMRPVELLKRIFQDDDEEIIFVNNEKVFRDAVAKDGYNAYFVDASSGDFDHCTDRGNKLLAENIANVILKEVFHQ